MKDLRLFVVLGAVALVLGLSADVRSAHAIGDWFRADSNCVVRHEPHVRHRVVRKHIVRRPGIYEIERRPGLYGYRKVKVRTRSGHIVYRKKRVLLRPYENIARYHKPDQRWVHESQRVYAPAPVRPRGAWPDGC